MTEQNNDVAPIAEHVVVGTDPESGVITAYAFKHRESTMFPAIRIKKIMLADNEVGKIKKESPALLEQLINAAAGAAQADGAKLLSAGHLYVGPFRRIIHSDRCFLKRVVVNNPKWDFIQQLVENIPDLPEVTEGEAPKRSRRKKDTTDDGNDEPKIKKSGAKRASAASKRGKKKEEDVSEPTEAMDISESAAVTEMSGNSETHPAGPVFVDVSLSAPSVQAPPAMSTVTDDDDFDA